MGGIFGKLSSEEPDYNVVKSGNYEIREYAKGFVAEIGCKEDNREEAYSALTKYFGVSCAPENSKGTVRSIRASKIYCTVNISFMIL